MITIMKDTLVDNWAKFHEKKVTVKLLWWTRKNPKMVSGSRDHSIILEIADLKPLLHYVRLDDYEWIIAYLYTFQYVTILVRMI